MFDLREDPQTNSHVTIGRDAAQAFLVVVVSCLASTSLRDGFISLDPALNDVTFF